MYGNRKPEVFTKAVLQGRASFELELIEKSFL